MSETSPAIRVLNLLLRLLQVGCIALIIAPWLAGAGFRQFGLESSPSDGLVRTAAVIGLIAFGLGRFLLPGGNPAIRRRLAWSELATATGGTFTIEKRNLRAGDWTGGATIRWQIQGLDVTLNQVSGSKGSSSVRLTSIFPAAKEIRFSVLPNNFLTRAVTSETFVSLIQKNIANQKSEATELDRASAVRDLGTLAGTAVSLGDSRLEGRLLVKSNTPDLARYVLSGAGVTERMNALLERRRYWTMAMYTMPGATSAELAMDLSGKDPSREDLIAARELFDVLLGSLRHNGVVGPTPRGESGGHDQLRMAR